MTSTLLNPIKFSELFSIPLLAASGANTNLCKATANFIKTVGFKNDEDTNDGGDFGEAQMLKFTYNIPEEKFENGMLIKKVSKKIMTIPLLAILNIPSLQIDKVSINFEVEMIETVESTSSSRSSGFRTYGRLTNDTTTNVTAESVYKVNIEASQKDDIIGLERFITALSNTASENTAESYYALQNINVVQSNDIINVSFNTPADIGKSDILEVSFTPTSDNVKIVSGSIGTDDLKDIVLINNSFHTTFPTNIPAAKPVEMQINFNNVLISSIGFNIISSGYDIKTENNILIN